MTLSESIRDCQSLITIIKTSSILDVAAAFDSSLDANMFFNSQQVLHNLIDLW